MPTSQYLQSPSRPAAAAPLRRSRSSEARFRTLVRRFLDDALTEDLRAAGRATIGTHSEIGACRIWHRRLYEQGWIAPAWPKAHGGTGWNATERLIFDQECAANDAPMLFAGGLRNVGPLLIALGCEAQKSRYLPPILSGDEFWCQGYSEAGAGSDLAALRTRAHREGDQYVVNGAKIWTTGANHAEKMFALVRTDSSGKPQQGITFLLIDMRSPGITIRPVQTIHGEAEFNEVHFEDVRVPVADRVGAEDDGWTVAKQLMLYARASNTTCALLRRTLRRVETVLATAAPEARHSVRNRLADVELRLAVIERLEYDAAGGDPDAGDRSQNASMMKLRATELHQRMTELLLELAGPDACRHWASRDELASTTGAYASAKYFATRAASIYSGTSEVHRNILGRQLLG